MKFIVDGTQVYCVRTEKNIRPTKAIDAAVVSFDAHLRTIAPHVAAVLRADERAELTAWLRQRESIKERSTDSAMIASLAELLAPAAAAIAGGTQVDSEMLERLREGVQALDEALDEATPVSAHPHARANVMDNSERLRAHLEVLRQAL